MPLAISVPETTDNDTIVARLTNDNNLVGLAANDFTLHRADTDAALTADISETKAGNHFWDITVRNTANYRGSVFLRIRANAFRDLQTLARIPSRPLDSNQFRFFVSAIPAAPSNFAGVASITSATLTWDAEAGKTYEVRTGSGAWADATSPHQVTGLTASTQYTFEVRVKAAGSVAAGSAASVTLTTQAVTSGPLTIEDIDEQFIPIGTLNYELSITISRQNVDARVGGLQEGFYQTFETQDDGSSQLKIKAEEVTRLIDAAVWRIDVRDKDDNTEIFSTIDYHIVPVGPVFVDPGRQTIYKGVPFVALVEVRNDPSVQRASSELVGLKSDTVTIDDIAYIKSEGRLPADANLTFSTFNADYYIENSGGSDNLQVPFDIRDDAVAPVLTGLASSYDYLQNASVNIPFTITATPDPMVSLQDAPDWLRVERVAGTQYRLVGDIPEGATNYAFKVIVVGLQRIEFAVTFAVTAGAAPVFSLPTTLFMELNQPFDRTFPISSVTPITELNVTHNLPGITASNVTSGGNITGFRLRGTPTSRRDVVVRVAATNQGGTTNREMTVYARPVVPIWDQATLTINVPISDFEIQSSGAQAEDIYELADRIDFAETSPALRSINERYSGNLRIGFDSFTITGVPRNDPMNNYPIDVILQGVDNPTAAVNSLRGNNLTFNAVASHPTTADDTLAVTINFT